MATPSMYCFIRRIYGEPTRSSSEPNTIAVWRVFSLGASRRRWSSARIARWRLCARHEVARVNTSAIPAHPLLRALAFQHRKEADMVRFKRILVPVDFFPASLRAYEYALQLASNYDACVYLLHVVAPIIPSGYGAAFSVGDITTELLEESRRRLAKLKSRAAKLKLPVQADVRLGDIDLEIRRAISVWKADLLVMGTHGRRGFERWCMGSQTERLMRRCPVPLLAISSPKNTATAAPEIRRILVTTDFSDGTADAIAHAFSIAQENQSKITVLHVVNDEQ